MVKRSAVSLLRWLALVVVVATLGALASRDAGSFYAQLTRPPWAPPSWLFGPAWTLLYLLMALAAWRVDISPRRSRAALVLFMVQLAVNALWSWLFFSWHLGGAAFVDVLLLDALVIATVAAFWRIDRLAAVLLVPYLGWIFFATALNGFVWRANPALLG